MKGKVIISDRAVNLFTFNNQDRGAITLFPFCFIRPANVSPETINHEQIHIAQQVELLVLIFFLIYGFWIVWDLTFRHDTIYVTGINNPLEAEAYNNQANLKYLDTRKWFAEFRSNH